jgi:hypothetical protein
VANKNLDTAYAIGKRLVGLEGSFVPLTGAGTIVAANVRGFGFGFAPNSAGVMALQAPLSGKGLTTTPGIIRAGTGLYTITFEDTYLAVNYFGADLAVPVAGSALWAQPVEPINIGSGTAAPAVQILIVNNAGAPTDASANMRVYFEIVFRDSNVQFVKP